VFAKQWGLLCGFAVLVVLARRPISTAADALIRKSAAFLKPKKRRQLELGLGLWRQLF